MTTRRVDNPGEPGDTFKQSRDPSSTDSVRQQNPLAEYLFRILAGYCRLSQIKQAAVLKANSDSTVHVVSACPSSKEINSQQDWLNHSARLYSKVIAERQSVIQSLQEANELYGQTVQRHLLLVPFDIFEVKEMVAAFLIETTDTKLLELLCLQIQHGFYLLGLSEARTRQDNTLAAAGRLTQAINVMSAINSQNTFTAAAMALCNEMAAQWSCERVSLGFLSGRYVRVKAMNHTEEFSRKMELVGDIESAMEECLDQDTEVAIPASAESGYIYRAAEALSRQGIPRAVLSLPLRLNGDVFAVVTLERALEKPFSTNDIETLRLACELCSPRLSDLFRYDRWFGSLLAEKMRRMFAVVLGATHTWTKIAGLLAIVVVLFLIFAKGPFRPDAPFVLEAVQQQVIPAPFDGYLKTVEVDVGQTVLQNSTVLATLDTAELRLQLAAAQADRAGYLKQIAAAMRDNETAQAQIAQANADKVQAQIDLLNHQIEQAQLTTPLGGVVVKGDLKRQIGAPVRTGDILFEVCPIESIRAQLLVPDDLILYLEVGQEGRLATASYPDKPIRFVVERIDPMAEVVNQRNVFKVRARLMETYPWMRPGMEGVAKVDVGKRRYIWIWTRKLTNWLRMKLWL